MSVKMVPTLGVVVVRDGKRIRPTIGQAFDFTVEERDSILSESPRALRKPTNEDTGADQAVEAASTKSSAEESQAEARGGKKKATANKSDKEAASEDDL